MQGGSRVCGKRGTWQRAAAAARTRVQGPRSRARLVGSARASNPSDATGEALFPVPYTLDRRAAAAQSGDGAYAAEAEHREGKYARSGQAEVRQNQRLDVVRIQTLACQVRSNQDKPSQAKSGQAQSSQNKSSQAKISQVK